jgi:iron complex outermembrane receptor protein
MAFLTANFRRDGSSMFGNNKQWGNFGGISAGVDFAKIFDLGFFDRLKLRGGYGTTGNLPPSPYLSKNLFNVSNEKFFYNGEFINAYAPVRNDNPDLQWEVKKELDFGLDFYFWNYRIGGSIDYYQSTSSELILNAQVPVPPYPSGRMYLNMGELSNSGLEFAVNVRAIENKKWSWTTGFNFTKYFDTKLDKITSPITTGASTIYLGYLGAPFYTGIPTIIASEGEPIGQIIAPVYIGMDTAGVMQYESLTDTTGVTSIPSLDDYQNVGTGLPKFQFGWNNSFTIGNFDVNFFIRGVFGHYLVNINNARYGNPRVIGIQNGMDQAKDFVDVANGPIYSSIHVEKANYVKLDNFSLGYNFMLPENKYIGKIRVYFSGQNLFIITNYSGVSPEVRYGDAYDGNNPLAPGLDRENTYFTSRSFTFGVSVNF